MHSTQQYDSKENAQSINKSKDSLATMEQPSRTIVHAKLEMTTPGSQEEQEADAAADVIVNGGKVARSSFGGSKASGISVSPQMESQLGALQGRGQQMPQGLRSMMERGFGRDFSQVRLHTDSTAADMSSSIHAKAFTHGNDIYFNQGQFNPETTEGKRLVGHELAHVSQGGGKIARDPDEKDQEDTSNEKQHVSTPSFIFLECLSNIDIFPIIINSEEELIKYFVKIIKREEGYLEKQSKDKLFEKEANKGDNNYVKYSFELDESVIKKLDAMDISQKKENGWWCDWFVHWCFVNTFHPLLHPRIIEEQLDKCYDNITKNKKVNRSKKSEINNAIKTAKKEYKKIYISIRNEILKYTMYEEKLSGSVSESIKRYGFAQSEDFHVQRKNKEYLKEPQRYKPQKDEENDNSQTFIEKGENEEPFKEVYKGDVVFFYNARGKLGHIGLTIEATNTTITTIEGNTRPDKGVESNGGGVYIKHYDKDNAKNIAGFGRPNYRGLLSYLSEYYNNYVDNTNKVYEILQPLEKYEEYII